MTTSTDAIVATVLYEGYLLWPYRRSARKNRQRWTLGGCYPKRFSETAGSNDPWWKQSTCLVTGDAPVVSVTVRFLHVVRREVYRGSHEAGFEPSDILEVGDDRYSSWEEATERSVVVEPSVMTTAGWYKQIPIHIGGGTSEQPLYGSDGKEAGQLVRHWHNLEGLIEIENIPLADSLFKLRVRVDNTTGWNGEDRPATLGRTFVSLHAVFSVQQGQFVSLLDPPEELQQATEACHNVGTWPVLVGDPAAQDTMLSSPIILYDYPQLAPESPGDLFDGTEIDQLLTLNILALSDEEKEEMRSTDPRGRDILSRTESLTENDFMRLHGTFRERPEWEELNKPPPSHISIGHSTVTKGTRVRLLPRAGGDVWDVVLSGQTACVEAIEQDLENRIRLAVSLDADPGRDLANLSPGHRFFFSPDVVEVITNEPLL